MGRDLTIRYITCYTNLIGNWNFCTFYNKALLIEPSYLELLHPYTYLCLCIGHFKVFSFVDIIGGKVGEAEASLLQYKSM